MASSPPRGPPIPQNILDAANVAREAVTSLAKQANIANDPFFDLESPLALPEEKVVVDLFRSLLDTLVTDEPQCHYPEITGDITLLRCLRGRCFDIQDCYKTFATHIAMRKLHGLNEIRQRIVAAVEGCSDGGGGGAAAAAAAAPTDPYHFDMTDQVHGDIAQKYVYCIPNAGYTPQGHVIIFTPAGGHDTTGSRVPHETHSNEQNRAERRGRSTVEVAKGEKEGEAKSLR